MALLGLGSRVSDSKGRIQPFGEKIIADLAELSWKLRTGGWVHLPPNQRRAREMGQHAQCCSAAASWSPTS